MNGTEKDGCSATFCDCPNLKVATGTYEGFVGFQDTGVTTIKDLIIKNSDREEEKAYFYGCPISYAPEKYRGKGFMFDHNIIENSIIMDETIYKIKSETNNIEI